MFCFGCKSNIFWLLVKIVFQQQSTILCISNLGIIFGGSLAEAALGARFPIPKLSPEATFWRWENEAEYL
ncbi:MAG: hypothetical protein A2W93_14920 [Bacteroidetes bacterium GWF2_43_63]|nr:MAG: hypothetical protein A2W94_01490 [Bacteroidetes bacterium GWE2_42_42]OFY52629.1 MAG: hypothetical protein A2W93_14920 [Bacteroidetes bacterium GWF2_43_63]HBG69903.1 hypothetical protein [Bacteroidales bacterium]HCB62671.1 hypothetical protein [Bacteroidales bacterium]HCY23791.1 hypothetical protein [Bacteroidales bacterium]